MVLVMGTVAAIKPADPIREMARNVVEVEHAALVRDTAQKECEGEQRAVESLLTRGNGLLAASGVAISLLVALTRDETVRGSSSSVYLLESALLLAVVACVLAAIGIRFRRGAPVMEAENIFASQVQTADATEWRRDYLMSLALAYADMRRRWERIRASRARWLMAAQGFYLVFILNMAALALTILL